MREGKYGIGARHKTSEGYWMEIVEKIDRDRRRVRFDNGYEVEVFIQAIRIGEIKNPYHLSVYGVGYFGVGEYKGNINRRNTPEYAVWQSMFQRCYDKKIQEKYPTYKGVVVCKEWHNFQNFAQWYHDNFPKIEGVKFHLDKDLLQQPVENKTYSPDTCVFLPKNVNTFLSNKHSDNTSGYIGVICNKSNKKWRAQINLFGEGKRKSLGYFFNPEEASLAYQSARKIEAEKVKDYLRSLNYLSEEIIRLIC